MHGASVDILDRAELGVGRHEVIVRGDLQTMAAVVKQRNVGLGRFPAEVRDHLPHFRLVGVDSDLNVEAQRFQGVADIPGVIGRIGEFGDRLVTAVADDQGDAALRPSGLAQS